MSDAAPSRYSDEQRLAFGRVAELYDRVPALTAGYIFSDVFETPIVAAAHGDSSGVRGAAWLWPPP